LGKRHYGATQQKSHRSPYKGPGLTQKKEKKKKKNHKPRREEKTKEPIGVGLGGLI